MPLYRGTLTKINLRTGNKFSNVYTVSDISALEALDVLNAIQIRERDISYDTIKFLRGHVVNLADKTDARFIDYGSLGALDPTGLGGPLPDFLTVRCVFSDSVKKPEQKYLRLAANEANLTLGLWDEEFVAFVQENYVDHLLALGGYVGPSGEPHTTGTVLSQVQDRQLGWHRRTRPGFHRGWVPD